MPDNFAPDWTALLPVFNILPDPYLLLSPELVIEAASDAYLAATVSQRENLIGRFLFDVFPDNPDVPEANAVRNLRGSFDQVLATRRPHTMPRQRYDVPDASHPGRFVERYWLPRNAPVLDEQGQVRHIVHAVLDETARVHAEQALQAGNQEFVRANTALSGAQLELQQLNQQLDTRVSERTFDVQAALHEAEQQRELLRRQQLMLNHILEQVPAAVATLEGPEHRFVFFNERYQRLATGRAHQSRTVAEALPEVVEQGFMALLDGVFSTGQPFVGTERPLMLLDTATGLPEQRYVDFSYQPLHNGDGQVQGVLAFIIDVTDKVVAHQRMTTMQAELLAAAQRRLLERENLYQVFEQTPAAVLLLREPNHRIEYFNPAYGRLFPGRQLRGLPLAEAQPEAAEQGFVALLDQVYQTGQTFVGNELPLSIMQPDGQPSPPRYFNFTYQAYREQDEVAGVSVFAFDTTEQVLARQQREAQQDELRRIFEQAPVAIAIMRGPSLVLELANQAMTRIWGRSLPEVLGRPFFQALPDAADQGLEQILAGVLESGTAHSITDMPVTLARAHTGQSALGYFNFVFQPLYNEHNRPTGLIALGTEVTEQVLERQASEMSAQQLKQLTEALQATNNQLTRTNTDLDTFVYTASHDLKAPIANIEGLLLALREQLPPEALAAAQVTQLLALMQDSVARFQQTLGYLSDVAKLQLAQIEPTEPLDLAAHIEAVRLDLMPVLQVSRGQLVVDVTACPTAYFSPKNLRSILYNLISNGLKYAHPDRPPTVQLRSSCLPGRVVLEVQDNGLGLTQEQQGKLFVMFQRLHTHVEGSGVGLYMVKRIVENAGGNIEVQSQLGVGTKFTVLLPAPTT